MNFLKKNILLAVVILAPSITWSATTPLVGDYQLDFFASSGRCEEDVYIRYEDNKLTVGYDPTSWGYNYRVGSFCLDRTFGAPPAVATCSTYVENNTFSNNDRKFDSIKTLPVRVAGSVQRRPATRYTLNLLFNSRLQIDSAGYDRDGLVEQPAYRCVYQRN